MEKIEDILEKCIELLKEGKSISDCLSLHPNYQKKLSKILPLVDDLNNLSKEVYLPDLENISTRIKNKVLFPVTEKRVFRFSFMERLKPALVKLALIILLLFFSSGGAVFASKNSLPGDLLYPVKETKEQILIALTKNPDKKAVLLTHLIAVRIEELKKLYEKRRAEKDLKIGLQKLSVQTENLISILAQTKEVPEDLLQKIQLELQEAQLISEFVGKRYKNIGAELDKVLQTLKKGREQTERTFSKSQGKDFGKNRDETKRKEGTNRENTHKINRTGQKKEFR
jgi:hypothetical protein